MSPLAVNLTRIKKGNGSLYSVDDLSGDHPGARRQCKERSGFENINVKWTFGESKEAKFPKITLLFITKFYYMVIHR